MFIWIIEIIPSEFHGPVHASFRVDHSNRYRGAHTHTLSLSLLPRGKIASFGEQLAAGWPDVHHRHECRYRYR